MMMSKSGLRFVAGGVMAMLGGGCGLLIGYEDATLHQPDAGTGGATTGTGGQGGAGGASACEPGSTAPCYSGPDGTQGVGICKAGSKTCNAEGSAYGACMGDVIPSAETCADSTDENCDGHDCGIWAHLLGDSANEFANGVAVDSAGNIYVIGTFAGTLQLGADSLIASGKSDVFLIKLDSSGHYLWGKQFGDAYDQQGDAIAVDSSGNVIIAGASSSPIEFGGPAVDYGIFVAKLDSNGQHLWSKSLAGGGTSSTRAVNGLATTSQGDIAMVGTYHIKQVNFDDGPMGVTDLNPHIFVAKLAGIDGSTKASNGFWGMVLGSAQAYQYGKAVAIDTTGNIYIACDFNGTIKLGFTTMTSSGSGDMLLAKLAPNGSPSWSRQLSSPTGNNIYGLAVDSSGSVIATGAFGGTINFGGGPITAAGGTDAFVVKYSTTNIHQWSKTFGDASYQDGRSVVLNSGGDIFLTGSFNGEINLGSGPLTAAGSGSNTFLARLTSNNMPLWSKRYGDANQQPTALAIGPGSGLVLTGWTSDSLDFGTGLLKSGGGIDGFVAGFGQ